MPLKPISLKRWFLEYEDSAIIVTVTVYSMWDCRKRVVNRI